MLINTINPICFGWRKILPVTYENFLSETEILEYIREKINECIQNYNTLIAELPADIQKITDERIKVYVNELNSKIDELSKSLDSTNIQILELSRRIDNNEEKTENELKALNEKILLLHNDVLSQFKSFTTEINEKLAVIRNDLISVEVSLTEKMRVNYNSLVRLMVIKDKIVVAELTKKIDNIAFNIQVVNPVTNRVDSLQNVLNYIVSYFGDGLTCKEYRELELTCIQYRLLGITCYDYRIYGIHDRTSVLEIRDMNGVENAYPFSSVFTSCGNPPPLNNFNLSVDELNRFLDKYNINEIDMAGQYILSNHFNSYLEHSLKLVSDSFNVEGDGTSVQMFKIPLHLQTDVEGITATNVLSEEKLSTCVCAYPSIDWVTDDCTRYKLQFVNFSFENETINANFRLYNPRQLTEVVCVLDVEAICKA